MSRSATQQLFDTTARRHRIALAAARFRLCAIALGAAALAIICAARLLALVPDWITPAWLLLIPALALPLAFLLTRKPTAREVARVIDDRTGSRELFLTAALIDATTGDFQPIVLAQAEERAAQIQPAQVVPFRWQRGARDVAVALALLLAAIFFLPQLDPFGKGKQRQQAAKQEERLRESKQLTALRADQLAAKSEADAEKVEQALAALEQTFKEAQPKAKEADLRRLSEHQKELGAMWRQVKNELPRDAFEQGAQSFGQADPRKAQQWREELKKGDISAAKKELAQLRDEIRRLAAMPDSAEKRALQQQLSQRLGSLAQGLKQAINSPELNAALARALDQLDQAKLGALARDATQSAIDSLSLTEQELEQLARALKNGQALEDALKNLQMAKKLAELGQLEGAECQQCNGMGDYAALFAKKMGAGSQPGGPGMGAGIGNGSRRPEDDSATSAFKPEKSRSALSGGKMLLQWKTSEVGDTGARAEDYREQVRQVKQGVSEAIVAEQVPPGYHSAIQKYFDSLPEKK